MNKVFLLVSFCLFLIIIILNYDTSNVQSYIVGDSMLKLYTDTDGQITRHEYYTDGIINQSIEYQNGQRIVERNYSPTGKLRQVNRYKNDQLIRTTYYALGIAPYRSIVIG